LLRIGLGMGLRSIGGRWRAARGGVRPATLSAGLAGIASSVWRGRDKMIHRDDPRPALMPAAPWRRGSGRGRAGAGGGIVEAGGWWLNAMGHSVLGRIELPTLRLGGQLSSTRRPIQ
jgi:hypothetical protein